jgi:hypothetical protein
MANPISTHQKGISEHNEAYFLTPLNRRAVTGWVVKILINYCSLSNTTANTGGRTFLDISVWYGSRFRSYAVEACQYLQSMRSRLPGCCCGEMLVCVLVSQDAFGYGDPTKSVFYHGNDFRHMAMSLGVPRSRYNAHCILRLYHASRTWQAKGRHGRGYLAWLFNQRANPRKKSIHNLLDYTKKRHPAC